MRQIHTIAAEQPITKVICEQSSTFQRIGNMVSRATIIAGMSFAGTAPASATSTNAANEITVECIPPGLEFACPTVTQEPNDNLTWEYPETPSNSYYQTDNDIWLMVNSDRTGNFFWGLGSLQRQTSDCKLVGEKAVFGNGITSRYAPSPSKDFDGLQAFAASSDPLVSLQVEAYCSHFKPTTLKNFGWAPAEISITNKEHLNGFLAPRTVVETFMGSSLVGLEVDGKLVPNIAGQIDFKRELAMVSAHFTRAAIGKTWSGKMEVTDMFLGQVSFTRSPVVSRSNISDVVSGKVLGGGLENTEKQSSSLNWSIEIDDGII